MVKVVYVTFPTSSGKYLFEVPTGTDLTEGQVVFVQNKNQHKPTQVVCATDSFAMPEKAVDIMLNEVLGMYHKPLSKVIGIGIPSYTMVTI